MDAMFNALVLNINVATVNSNSSSSDSNSSKSEESPNVKIRRKPSLVIYAKSDDEDDNDESRNNGQQQDEIKGNFVSYINNIEEDDVKNSDEIEANVSPKTPNFIRSKKGRSRSGDRVTPASVLPMMLERKLSLSNVLGRKGEENRATSNGDYLQGQLGENETSTLRRSQSSREVSNIRRKRRFRMRRKGSFAFGRSFEDIKENDENNEDPFPINDEEDDDDDSPSPFARGFRGLRRTLTLGSVTQGLSQGSLTASLASWNKSFRQKWQDHRRSFSKNLDSGFARRSLITATEYY